MTLATVPMDDIGDSTLGLCNGNAMPTLTCGVNGPLRFLTTRNPLYKDIGAFLSPLNTTPHHHNHPKISKRKPQVHTFGSVPQEAIKNTIYPCTPAQMRQKVRARAKTIRKTGLVVRWRENHILWLLGFGLMSRKKRTRTNARYHGLRTGTK